MIAIELTENERLQFQYILPVQGSLEALELVEQILGKIEIGDSVEFSDIEMQFIKNCIKYLDKQKQVMFSSLSLIKKILKIGD